MIKRISSRLRHQVNYALLATGKDSSSRSTKRSHQPKCTLQSKQDEPVDANLHTPPSSPANTEHDHDPNKQDNDDKDEQLSLESFLNCDIDENFFRKYGNGSATAADPTASSSIKGRRGRPKRKVSNSETGTVPNTSTTHNDRAEISPESLLSGRSPRKRVRSSLLRQYDIDNGGQMINVSGVVRRPRRRRIFDETTVTDMDLSAQNSGSKNFEKSTTTILRPKVKVDEIIRPKIRLLQKSFLAADSTDLKAYTGVRRSRKQRRRIETDNRNSCGVDVQIANNKHNNASSTTTSNNSARESSVTASDQAGNSGGSKKTDAKLKQPDNSESISTDNDKIRRKSLPRRHLKLPLALSSEEFDLGRNIAIPQLLLNKSWNYSKRLRKCPQSGYYRLFLFNLYCCLISESKA
ncbi:unnamed protein product [Anisakis simplex]|uniref:Bromo adjacent domain-containing 1 protein n=1 Tax=Anisakis simplex TaxID=6269 RepID=A0A0M3KBY6_ANISI|nr:unnamed protein product [Anisakis simplex]